MTAEILTVTASCYHADTVADQPTLSASIAKILVTQSPLHAWTQHPRLNPYFVREEDDKFSIGVVAHAVLLEGVDALNVVEVCEFDSWRSGDAKAAKEASRAAGKIPLLGKHYFDVLQMVDAARKQLDAHEASPPLFRHGKPEQTIVWDEAGVSCRARLDWLHDDHSVIDDLKSTSVSAKPDAFERTLYNMGYHVQAALYRRGVCAVTGVEPEFRFAIVETSAPYAVSVLTPGPDMLALADAQVDYAINLWRDCLANDSWPGYSTRVATAELPAWAESQWMERSAA